MSPSRETAPVAEGEVIDGKYRVDRVLGVGGMGIVVAATHVHLDQRVALKFLLPTALAHAEVVARFTREARSAVKIQSQHVAKILDVGTLSTGAPYMVMEYLEGEDLEQLLTRVGPLPVQDAVDYVMQACEAVAEAHGYGIVHRDLKPANLFLATRANGRPVVKVLDFGISKSLSKADASLTKTSAIMGSPLYMSPEQMASARSVDVRSDIWALGIILYEVLTQQLAFMADSMPELVVAVLHRAPEPLRALRPDVPEGLEAAVMRCLEKDPSRRFADIPALAAALAPYGRDGSTELADRIAHSLDRVSTPSVASTTGAARATGVAPASLAASFTVASWTQSGSPTVLAKKRATGGRGRALALGGLALVAAVGLVAGGVVLTHGADEEAVVSSGQAGHSIVNPPTPAAAPTAAQAESHAEPPATGEQALPPPPPESTPTGSSRPAPASLVAGRAQRPTPQRATVPVASAVEAHPAPAHPAAPATPKTNPLDLKLQN
jgi:serine/threonine protein kinase